MIEYICKNLIIWSHNTNVNSRWLDFVHFCVPPDHNNLSYNLGFVPLCYILWIKANKDKMDLNQDNKSDVESTYQTSDIVSYILLVVK